jgi:putative endonuclease
MSGTEKVPGTVYYTYMVRCADGSLYTGFTVYIEHRIQVHNSGKGARYTRSRRPVSLAWCRKWDTEHEARSAEMRIKHWKKEQKESLAASFGKERD